MFDEIFDVIVVGSGAAGMAAASVSAHSGARTVLLEKDEHLGGTTRKASGGSWILNNPHMQSAGISDPKRPALEYMARLSRPATYDATHPTLGMMPWEFALMEAFYDNGSTAIADLERIGAYTTWPMMDFPDYFGHLPENEAPKGRLIFPASGVGDPTGGIGMIDEFASAVIRFGGTIRTGHTVLDVVRGPDGIEGVVVDDGTTERKIGATGGVIFSTGGFMRDPELRELYLDAPYLPGCGAMTNTGDFVRIAWRLGTQLAAMGRPWTAPIVVERTVRETATVAATFNIPGDGFLAVNCAGLRAVNEKAPYCEFTRTFLSSDTHESRYPNFPLILIWDDQQQNDHAGEHLGNPFPPEGTDAYWVVSGSNINELTEKVGRRLRDLGPLAGNAGLDKTFEEQVTRTIHRFNEYANSGIDPDFKRGETPYERFMAELLGPGTGPNSTMRPLDLGGPLHATILGPSAFETKGGPRTDTSARVLDSDGAVIEGLYAAGNCAASPSVDAYWSGGASIGWALCFGWVAGRHASARVRSAATTR